MRRADRLFQIIQNLRHDRTTTALQLAETLEVSERTIYRDIQDLSRSGVPISSETGAGYRLLGGFQIPPLMFTDEEIDALMLGARMVRAWTDKALARSATQAMQKIEAVIPDRLKAGLAREELLVPDLGANAPFAHSLMCLRAAVKERRRVSFTYTREDGACSTRVVQPLGLFYWGRVWTLVAWCELRGDFRHFRLDRMSEDVDCLDTLFDIVPGRTLQDFLNLICDSRSS